MLQYVLVPGHKRGIVMVERFGIALAHLTHSRLRRPTPFRAEFSDPPAAGKPLESPGPIPPVSFIQFLAKQSNPEETLPKRIRTVLQQRNHETLNIPEEAIRLGRCLQSGDIQRRNNPGADRPFSVHFTLK
jgi:hypothetical protein